MPRWNIRRIAVIAGFVGVGLIVLGSLITALAYRGRLDEPYSFLSHFVSELGEVGVSDWAAVFNLGLIAGGLCLTVFMLALAVVMRHWFSVPFGLVGVITGVSGALVGVFPMNDMDNHVTVAMTFFNTGWIVTGLFALYVLLARGHAFPRWLAVPGLVAAVCFVAFLQASTPGAETTTDVLAVPTSRPEVWIVPILEWAVIASVLVWIALTALVLHRQTGTAWQAKSA